MFVLAIDPRIGHSMAPIIDKVDPLTVFARRSAKKNRNGKSAERHNLRNFVGYGRGGAYEKYASNMEEKMTSTHHLVAHVACHHVNQNRLPNVTFPAMESFTE
jgi:hypothetical protein